MATSALVFLLGAASCTNALTFDEDVLQFREWKDLFGKEYETSFHEEERFVQWKANKHMISNHNMRNKHFQLSLNKYADLSNEEFTTQYKMKKINPQEVERTGNKLFVPENVELPMAVDWRNKDVVTPIKDQGQCGSCYAFATTGALEGSWAKATGNLQSFSEQQIVDCSGAEGDYGCNGGLPDHAFNYIKSTGIELESDYPYHAVEGKCKSKDSKEVGKVSSWTDVTSGDEEALKYAVATHGPVAVAIDANHQSFQLYKSGVYVEPNCTHQIDHAVLVVGYGTTDDGQDYWLVKNSWGETWGDNGYIKMQRNNNSACAIADLASFPLVPSNAKAL